MIIWLAIGVVWVIIGMFFIKKEGSMINPVTLLCVLWGTIDIFSSIHLYGLYVAKFRTYAYINIGIATFVLGYYWIKIVTNNVGITLKNTRRKRIYCLRKRVCFVALAVCISFLGYKFLRFSNMILENGYSLGAIQVSVGQNEATFSGILNAISFLIVNPLLVGLPAAIISDYYVRKKNPQLLILSILLCLLRVLVSGGRQAFIQLFLYIFISLSFVADSIKKGWYFNKRKFNKKKMYIVTGICTVFVLLLLTMSRTSAIVKTIYLDFAMQPVMFEIWAEKVQGTNMFSYGKATFLGIIYPLCYIIKNFLGMTSIPYGIQTVYDMRLATMSDWAQIGPNLSANAYVTCFWYFFYDMRIYGIVIGMFVCGCLSYNIYIRAKRNPSSRNICAYILVATAIFYSFGDFYPSNPYYILGFIYAELLMFKPLRKGAINDKKIIT